VDHLRYAGLPGAEQRRLFLDIVWADPIVRAALLAARDLDLPDWLIVSGLLYNSVWNALTRRPPGYGTKDIDLFYFDAGDLSYEAEDAVISRGTPCFAHLPLPVEIRNQARVHLWYPAKFGSACPVYTSSAESVSHFASKTHAVGVRLLQDDRLELVAPFGVADIFRFHMTPNHALDNRETHAAKAARAMALWPEVTVEAW
jgi:uncharacterized protein